MPLIDRISSIAPKSVQKASPQVLTVQKTLDKKEGIAQNPLSQAYNIMNIQMGLRKPYTQVTMETLKRMSRTNWVDRTCITTLRDEITSLPWDIVPIDPKKPYSPEAASYFVHLLKKPNRNKENFRTFMDKVLEDILTYDAGCVEKVRNQFGMVLELWNIDGGTIKPRFDIHGISMDPAYQQYIPGQKDKDPVAEWSNDDFIYMQWNPQPSVDSYGYGMSPVEAGLMVGTAFLYAEAYNLAFFRQNSTPGVIINMGHEVDDSVVDQFRAFLAAEMMGEQGYFKPVIGSFGQGFDVKDVFKNPSDMEYSKYVEWQMRWKVALYRMSPQDIGFTLDQYKTEGQVQQQISKNKAVDSLKGVIKSYIDQEVIGDKGFDYKDMNFNLQFNWIDADTVDPLDQANIDKVYLDSGVKSINEVRQSLGLDPIIGGMKPTIIAGSTIIGLKPDVMTDQQEDEEIAKDVRKSFTLSEGNIVSLDGNETAICWMDDRGVTQPFFATDYGKQVGFTVKASFLDDAKDQEPPEEKVADLLRALKVNTPEVKICSYDDVLKLLPNHLKLEFTKWINLQPPFDSQEWRSKWGDTRMNQYYIVSGFINASDLGNDMLLEQMAVTPESYKNAVYDLARVWLAEARFGLGDRKPGHYLISQSGNGFGVDYQFYKDSKSFDKTKHFLPEVLGFISPKLLEYFKEAVLDQAADFGVEKSVTKSLDVKKKLISG